VCYSVEFLLFVFDTKFGSGVSDTPTNRLEVR
jgi:hypothetical protein